MTRPKRTTSVPDLTAPPVRLVEAPGELGELLRAGLSEPLVLSSERGAFERVEARRHERRSLSRLHTWGLAGAVAAAALALWFNRAALRFDAQRDALSISAEPLGPNSAGRAGAEAAPGSATAEVGQTEEPRTDTGNAGEPAEPSMQRTRASDPDAQRRPRTAAATETAARGSAASGDTAADAEHTLASCAGLARAAKYDQALACYDALAETNGMSAEMALYEKARLQNQVLDDREGALETLARHRQRFGKGALKREVDISRIDMLVKAGRRSAALEAIDQALASSGERKSELGLLKGKLLAQAGRCSEARAAYRAAQAAGADEQLVNKLAAACRTPAEPAPSE